MLCQQYSYINITQMRNKFIEIEQCLQLIKKLLRLSNIFYIARNFKKCNKENRFLRKQNNSSSATSDAKNFITSIIKIIVTT